MRQRYASAGWLLLFFSLGLFLVACERPLQEDVELTLQPRTTDGETVPGYPGAETTMAPGLLPTPTSNAPGGAEETPSAGAEATAEPATEAEATPAGDIIHTVVAGDTLGDIAATYGVTVEAIAAANNLPDVHSLEVGQQLLIPLSGDTGAGEDTAAGEETAGGEDNAGEETGGGEEQIYVVQPGDTLFRIGQQYGFTIEELVAYNNIVNPDRLEVGQQIRIPPEGYTVEP